MTDTNHQFPAPPADTWAALARQYREICRLRETGHAAAAASLENDAFAPAVAAARQLHGEAAFDPPALDSLKRRESDRVRDAFALAEVLKTLWPASFTPAGHASAAIPSATANLRPVAEPPTRAPVTTAPAIADLLDDMLAQERPDRAHRRSA